MGVGTRVKVRETIGSGEFEGVIDEVSFSNPNKVFISTAKYGRIVRELGDLKKA